MQPKLTLTIVSVALVLTGLVFFGFAEKITQGLWPKADAYAMNIGVVMPYILGASVITSVMHAFSGTGSRRPEQH